MRRFDFAAIVLAAAVCSQARADVITFGTSTFTPNTQTEGAFTYQRVSGNTWLVTASAGNPPSSLTPGIVFPSPGNRLDIYLTGGGLFTFDSVDFASASTASDSVNIFGDVGGVQTQQLLGISSSSTTFQTLLSGFSAPVDRLRIVYASQGISPVLLDNFVLTSVATTDVPEPATVTLWGIGLAGMFFVHRRRARRA